ncbi:Serine-threonine/tyrosine-protein kinase, catalytic domain [Dillenia turbinata]|uniref:Serine-threonine/tyrosine-protein kinase, catalytic domain n=1 Tax=Dillenia turbinata TaxID=194707 RepID=A0AAN8W193_9MAGN
MGKALLNSAALVIFVLSISIPLSEQLQSSQAQTLLRIQRLLNFPFMLSSWSNTTDFCNVMPTSSVAVVCYEESITQLLIVGEKKVPPLPPNFSMDSFVTTLVKLPSLKVLSLVSLGLWGPFPGKIARLSSLEILNMTSNYVYGDIPEEMSSLSSLQTLILDDNMFTGRLPDWVGQLPALTVLSLRKNSLNRSLPDSLKNSQNLRVLVLSHNNFSGDVPDLSALTNLQVLDLEDNLLGPHFPLLGSKLLTLVLRKNRFSFNIPNTLSSYHELEKLDVSFNRFVGPFPTSLVSLPSIKYLNIAGNRFTGLLSENLSCNSELEFVDLSSNLLTGNLPNCLTSDSKKRVVLYARNCLATSYQNQHPFSFCQNEALAVGILPRPQKKKHTSKAVVATSIIGGIFGGIVILGLVFLVTRKLKSKQTFERPPTRLIAENASTGYTSKNLSNARYVSQTTKLGALGLPAYRTFSLEELEEATNNFDSATFIGEGSRGQMYKGQLKDGSLVAIRCLKMKKYYSIQDFMHHIELTSKLRHRHLVSALGHCFECYLDDSSVSRVFLVFEYVPYVTLRSWISERRDRVLPWTQRISAAIGVAKAIQYLHTGIVPGVYAINLKIADVLLDQNLVAKISSYNLPLLAESIGKTGNQSSGTSKGQRISSRAKHEGKADFYDLGIILLEVIVGRPFISKNEVESAKEMLQESITADRGARRGVVDQAVRGACSDKSLKTMMEICLRCLHEKPDERPSVEDVLWNLQFAAQVQDAAAKGDSQSSDGSPISPCQTPHLKLALC